MATANLALPKLKDELDQTNAGYASAKADVGRLGAARESIIAATKASPMLSAFGQPLKNPDGSVMYQSPVGGGVQAVGKVNQQFADAETRRDSFKPKFNDLTNKLRSVTELTQANNLLRGAGAAPTADFSNVTSGPARTTAPVVPAAPVTQGGAATAVGGGGSDPGSSVLGTFNGRKITQADSDKLSAALRTTNGPVIFGPNGSFAASTGPGAPAPVAGAPAPAQPLSRPMMAVDNSRISSADSERRGFIGGIDDQLKALGPLNMRSKRDMATNLLQLKGGAVGQAGNLADAASGRALSSQTQMDAAQLGEAGANARSAAQEAGATDRTRMTLAKPELVTDGGGAISSVVGNIARPVLNPTGAPLRTVTATQEKQADRRQETMAALSKQAAEFLPAAGQPTPEQVAQARMLAAQTMGLQTATGPNGERGIIINGELAAF